ncbi:hypothetical protein CAMGR0001_0710 [Campylobacter gracilis RM3268]|uniref:Uncharacterized protein n=1 Tax=Campylobacter gracilis RM3268 TaxID=553220 RepID=C8PFR8_9BACT|nr:hypothetical protein CAMGR0001_0710 [Campylobacter gracilis RM3268]
MKTKAKKQNSKNFKRKIWAFSCIQNGKGLSELFKITEDFQRYLK